MKSKEIIIDKEYSELMPPLSTDAFSKLKKSIINEGCRDPLVLWDNVLLDGHNRYRICMENNIIFKRVEKNFESRELAKVWIIDNQLGKRNLNDAQRIDLVDKSLGYQEMENAKQRQVRKPESVVENFPPQNLGKSRDKLGEKAKVSGRQYGKGIKIKEQKPELWKECLDGDKSINEAYKEVTGMSEKTRQVLFSSEHDDWSTPKDRYKELDAEFHFDFDPCPFHSTFDGLQTSWKKNNFVNPPYSKIKEFLDKGHKELSDGNAEVLVYLIPVRTDTNWFHTFVYPYFKKEKEPYAEIRFVKGRIKFEDGTGSNCSAPFPSMIVIFKRK